jgi:hypothetical protein
VTDPGRTGSESVEWGLRAAWCLAGLALIWWGTLFYGYGDAHPWVAFCEIAATIAGLAAIGIAFTSRGGEPGALAGWAFAAISVIAFFGWAWLELRTVPGYRTDEVAFNQYAAQLLIHGHNPYSHSMLPSIGVFHVPARVTSLTLSGGLVTTLSYPALSFLVYAPFLLLGWSYQLAPIINIGAWGLAVLLGYALVPRSVKPLMIVAGSLATFTFYAVAGVTDMVMLPLLMVAVYRWDRYPERDGAEAWIAPLAMGLAMSIKQTPWLILPFILIGVALEVTPTRGARDGVQTAWSFLWRTLTAFVATNIVFFAISPHDWVKGVLAPGISNLIPQGQGWVALSTLLGIGGGDLRTYTVLMVAVLALCLIVFAAGYPRTKALAVIMPSVVFFFAARSQTTYLVVLIPAAIVAATTVRLGPATAVTWGGALWGTTRRRIAVGGATAFVAIALVGTLVWPPPLNVSIRQMWLTGQSALVNRIVVVARNTSGHSVRPVFFVKSSGDVTDPWIVLSGPSTLGAGQSGAFMIQAPNSSAQQRSTSAFQIVAATQSPPALSVSRTITPLAWGLLISPDHVNHPIASGTTLTFSTQVVDQGYQPIQHRGIPVFLTITTNPRSAIGHAVVRVNGQELVAGTATALTNDSGAAVFSVTIRATSLSPFSLQAHLFSSTYRTNYASTALVPIVVVRAGHRLARK